MAISMFLGLYSFLGPCFRRRRLSGWTKESETHKNRSIYYKITIWRTLNIKSLVKFFIFLSEDKTTIDTFQQAVASALL